MRNSAPADAIIYTACEFELAEDAGSIVPCNVGKVKLEIPQEVLKSGSLCSPIVFPTGAMSKSSVPKAGESETNTDTVGSFSLLAFRK